MGLFGLFGGGSAQYNPMIGAASGGGSGANLTAKPAEAGLQSVGIPGLTSMIAKGGQLSPYLKANLAAEKRGNLTEAQAGKQTALKSAAYRGLGGPSGAASSAENVINRGKETADTDALQRAYGSQAGLNLSATQGLSGIGQGFAGIQSQFLKDQLAAQQAKEQSNKMGLGGILGLASTAAGAFA
jgi:hypothetical protein